MASIITNTAAITALKSLNSVDKNLINTQNRIATGLRVSSAADNAAYYSIATTQRSDQKALGAVKDALGLGTATVDTAYTAVDKTTDLTSEIKSKLVAARSPGIDRAKIQSEITQLQSQLKSVADSASFSGQNFVSVDSAAASYNANKEIVASFTRTGASVSVGTLSIDTSTTKLYDANDQSGILDKDLSYTDSAGATQTVAGVSVDNLDISALTDSTADLATLDSYIAGVDAAVSEQSNAATTLGAVKTRIGLQTEFVSALNDAIKSGVGQLVDADLTEESTRLQALQTQQQLGIQALSIANSSSQNILSLFR